MRELLVKLPSFAGNRPIIGTLNKSQAPVYAHVKKDGQIEYSLLVSSNETALASSFIPLKYPHNDFGNITLLDEYKRLGNYLGNVVKGLTSIVAWEYSIMDTDFVKVGYHQNETIGVYGTIENKDVCFVWFAFGPVEETTLNGNTHKDRQRYSVQAKKFTLLPELRGIPSDILNLKIKEIIAKQRAKDAK